MCSFFKEIVTIDNFDTYASKQPVEFNMLLHAS